MNEQHFQFQVFLSQIALPGHSSTLVLDSGEFEGTLHSLQQNIRRLVSLASPLLSLQSLDPRAEDADPTREFGSRLKENMDPDSRLKQNWDSFLICLDHRF